MATQSVEPLTHWGRSADDGRLDLWRELNGRVVDLVELDVTQLPERPDLLARLGPKTRTRLLWEAREVGKGNLLLSPEFPGYDPSPAQEA